MNNYYYILHVYINNCILKNKLSNCNKQNTHKKEIFNKLLYKKNFFYF